MEKKVSVIIPCYNSIRFLDDCYQSLIHQTMGMEDLELIFVNDASTDDTWEMLERFEQEYPESIMIIDLKENMRQGGARNVGISYATGKYIDFLDSDDWARPEAYETLYKIAEEYQAQIVQYSHYDIWEDHKKCVSGSSINGLITIDTLEERKKFLIDKKVTHGSQPKFYNREFVNRVNSHFPEHVIYEEPLFVYPLMFYVTRLYCYNEPMYYCRQHNESTMHATAKEKNRLLDHPYVQLEVMKEMMTRTDIWEKYKAEIEYEFLWTYYVETICFAGLERREIDLTYFGKMQENVRKYAPTWAENYYVNLPQMQNMKIILTSLYHTFTQEELTAYCAAVVGK